MEKCCYTLGTLKRAWNPSNLDPYVSWYDIARKGLWVPVPQRQSAINGICCKWNDSRSPQTFELPEVYSGLVALKVVLADVPWDCADAFRPRPARHLSLKSMVSWDWRCDGAHLGYNLVVRTAYISFSFSHYTHVIVTRNAMSIALTRETQSGP